MADDTTYRSLTRTAAGAAADHAIGAPFGTIAVDFVWRLGADLIATLPDKDGESTASLLSTLKRVSIDGGKAPAVIGLGRCGSRVTAQLSAMIADARGITHPRDKSATPKLPSWVERLVRVRHNSQTYTLDPILVIGDLNKQTFADVKGLIADATGLEHLADSILNIDYRPLAEDGAGNLPIVGEFFTRGLLSLPPQDSKDVGDRWNLARTYLLHLCARKDTAPKLVFYIFGAAGGSGSGSVIELVRAQRFAVECSSTRSAAMYFTGVAVIPDDLESNKVHRRNTGRLIVQYLSELNILLSDKRDYRDSANHQYATKLRSTETDVNGHRMLPLRPLDGLGIISNQIMRSGQAPGDAQLAVERRANQYIAQQIFNLAAAQSAAESLTPPKDNKIAEGTKFQAIKLDVEDLINGLRGPFAVGFSAAIPSEVSRTDGIDRWVLRAIDLPQTYPSKDDYGLSDTVQGISICPRQRQSYVAMLAKLKDKLSPVVPLRERDRDDSREEPRLDETDLISLRDTLFFKRCPAAVVVLTSPADVQVSALMRERVAKLLTWILPNLKQARFAIITGTTPFYSLSLYFEGSVVLSYDVQDAIQNYLFSSWACRSSDPNDFDEFQRWFYEMRDQEPPITQEQIIKYLGSEEQYGKNVTDWNNKTADHEQRWKDFVSGAVTGISDKDRSRLLKHTIKSCMLTPSDIVAALSYINYIAHVEDIAQGRPRDE